MSFSVFNFLEEEADSMYFFPIDITEINHPMHIQAPFSDKYHTLIDTYLCFLMAVAILQFLFACLGGSFPFNAFLGGFSLCVIQFVLTVSLRLRGQLGEYIFASIISSFVCLHFIN